jgi:hypothetical protein
MKISHLTALDFLVRQCSQLAMKVPSKRLMFKLFLEPCLNKEHACASHQQFLHLIYFRSRGSATDENKGTKLGKQRCICLLNTASRPSPFSMVDVFSCSLAGEKNDIKISLLFCNSNYYSYI